jgi:hypothetical protein
MPTLEDYSTDRPIKVLLYGDSGAGKTGCLAALANAGQRLIIQDYDNGLDILLTYVKPEFRKNVFYKTLTDKMRSSPAGVIPVGIPSAASTGMKLIDNWVDGDVKLGGISKWGRDTTFVIDSGTFMGLAALRYIKVINGRPIDEQFTHQSDWGAAMKIQEGTFELLYNDVVKCNIVVVFHIIQLGGDPKTGEGAKGFPSALGRKLPPQVPRWFNNTIRVITAGGDRRVLRTNSTDELELKNVNPKAVKKEYPLGTGLADFFRDISGEIVKYEGAPARIRTET